jgi:tRNA threonylcarbamoyladenosine biosynthesis protein TsaB
VLILGIDTSGRQGSVALLQVQGGAQEGPAPAAGAASVAAYPPAPAAGAASVAAYPPSAQLRTLELVPLSGGQYSEVLVPAIAALLVRHGLEKSSLSLIAVASGPGSFTGLRVAIATAKGLAEAFAIPVVPVSVLEAIALTSGVEGRAVAAIDAQRGEVFFGEYILASAAPEPARRMREDLAGFGGFASWLTAPLADALASAPPPRVFTPDEGLAARLREAGCDAALVARPSAEDIAHIAHRKFLAGVRADVATLDANYLRRSDAEIFSAPKPGSVPYLK